MGRFKEVVVIEDGDSTCAMSSDSEEEEGGRGTKGRGTEGRGNKEERDMEVEVILASDEELEEAVADCPSQLEHFSQRCPMCC